MRLLRILILFALAQFFLAWVPTLRAETDTVEVQNNLDSIAVVLIAYRDGNGKCQDHKIIRTDAIANIGSALTNGQCISEVAVFSKNNATAFDTPVTTWTDTLGDVHRVLLEPIISVPVSVWLVRHNSLSSARDDFANAQLLYSLNNVGVQFEPTYKDVSMDSTAISKIGINCASAAGLEGSAWFTPDALNIYYIKRQSTGVTCSSVNPNIIYIGTIEDPATLSHEIAHAYGLRPSKQGGHVTNQPGFQPSNIMWEIGDGSRDHFSIGQAFRINTSTNSMLNANGNRVGSIRDCPPLTTSNICPALSLE